MFLDRVQKEAFGPQFEVAEPVSYSTQQWEREIFLRLLTNRTGWKVLVVWPSLGSEIQIMANQLGEKGELVIVGTNSAVLEQLKANKQKGIYTTRTTKTLRGNAVYKRDAKIKAAVHIETFDGLSLDFEDNSFDAAWCASHAQPLTTELPKSLVDDLYRVVRPDGYLAISQPSAVFA